MRFILLVLVALLVLCGAARAEDEGPPEVLDVFWGRASAEPGEDAWLVAHLADDSPIVYVHAVVERVDGGPQHFASTRHATPVLAGEHALRVAWPLDVLPGAYVVTYLSSMDVHGHRATHSLHALPAAQRTLVLGDISAPADVVAPVPLEVVPARDAAARNTTVELHMVAHDEHPVKRSFLALHNGSATLYVSGDGAHVTFEVPRDAVRGTYVLGWAALTDAIGNSGGAPPRVLRTLQVGDLPTAPRNGTTTLDPVGRGVRVAWEAPLDDGGLGLLSYRVYAVEPNGTRLAAEVPATQQHATDGWCPFRETCRYLVTAVSVLGEGAAGADTSGSGVTTPLLTPSQEAGHDEERAVMADEDVTVQGLNAEVPAESLHVATVELGRADEDERRSEVRLSTLAGEERIGVYTARPLPNFEQEATTPESVRTDTIDARVTLGEDRPQSGVCTLSRADACFAWLADPENPRTAEEPVSERWVEVEVEGPVDAQHEAHVDADVAQLVRALV